MQFADRPPTTAHLAEMPPLMAALLCLPVPAQPASDAGPDLTALL